jgi:hypothetical protein
MLRLLESVASLTSILCSIGPELLPSSRKALLRACRRALSAILLVIRKSLSARGLCRLPELSEASKFFCRFRWHNERDSLESNVNNHSGICLSSPQQ